MAFLLEDGTGLANSNGYIDIAYFDTWHGDRGASSLVALTQVLKEAAIIQATMYIDSRFIFKGNKVNNSQALEFGRENLYVDDILQPAIPPALQRAVAIYSGNIASGESLYINSSASGRSVKKEKVVLGPLQEETEYFGGERDSKLSSVAKFRCIPEADNFMKKLIYNFGSVKSLIRA